MHAGRHAAQGMIHIYSEQQLYVTTRREPPRGAGRERLPEFCGDQSLGEFRLTSPELEIQGSRLALWPRRAALARTGP